MFQLNISPSFKVGCVTSAECVKAGGGGVAGKVLCTFSSPAGLSIKLTFHSVTTSWLFFWGTADKISPQCLSKRRPTSHRASHFLLRAKVSRCTAVHHVIRGTVETSWDMQWWPQTFGLPGNFNFKDGQWFFFLPGSDPWPLRSVVCPFHS